MRTVTWVAAVGVAMGAGCSVRANSDDASDGTDVLDDVLDGTDDLPPPIDAAVTSPIDATVELPIDAALAPDATPADPPGLFRAVPTATGANPSPDGDDEEYANSPSYQIVLNDAAGNFIDVPNYAPSMVATVRAAYTTTYLSFFFDVVDSQLVNNSGNAYYDDAVTLYFDADGDNDGPWSIADREIIIDYGETVEVYNDDQGDISGPTIGKKVQRTDAGFTVEVRLKRSASFFPAGQLSLGFNTGLYDDDGAPVGTYFPNAYGLWFEGPAPRCADCCPEPPWTRPEAWCDSTFNGTLVLDP